MKQPTDSRKHQRVTVRIPVTIQLKSLPGAPVDGELLDLSIGGAFVHCTAPVRVGDEVKIEIRFFEPKNLTGQITETVAPEVPPPQAVSESVVVRWARGSSTSGFGVEFKELSSEGRAYLERVIRYFEQLARSGVEF
jgi:hypothetical protein